MADFALPVLVAVAAGILAHSATAHLRRPTALADDLARQRLLPGPVAAVVGVALGPAEAALALAAVTALVTGLAPTAMAVLLIGAGLAFLVHLTVLRRWRPGAPCGCTGDGRPPDATTAGRAAALVAGGLALGGDAAGRLDRLDGAETATVALASIALVLAVALVTAAHPAPDPVPA